MANVFFKRGLLNNLPQTIVDGTVYVTTDERAMYVDVNNTRIRIGDFVEYATVDQIRALSNPNPHALYFANDYSYLLKYDDSQHEWRVLNQIQPIGNIVRYIHERASTLPNSGAEKGAQVITELWSDENNNYNRSGTTKYTTSNESKLKITGTSNDASASDATQVGTVNFRLADTYDYTTLSAAVTNNGQTVTLSASSDRGGTDTNNVAVNTNLSTSAVTLKAGNGISFATGLNNAVEINAAAGINSVSSSFDNTGKLKVELLDSSENVISGTSFVTPTIQYGETTTSSTFGSNGITTLSVYTMTEVDNKITNAIKANNAMTFKGVVGNINTPSLPTTNVRVGDTYRVGADGNYGPANNQQYAKLGDLFIATGTEDSSTGYITGSINWELIPSGDDLSASYSFNYDNSTHTIQFVAGESTLTKFKIDETSGLTSESVTQNQVDTITIKHLNVTRSDTNNATATSISNNASGYTVVTGVSTNSQGHVTGVTTNKINASDTTVNTVTASFGSNLSAASSTTLTVSVTDSNEVVKTGRALLSSSTLQMNSASSGTGSSQVNGISMDLVWGTF